MQHLKWAAAVAIAAAAFFALGAAPAAAEDDDINVAPLDEYGSDETMSEEASSGFDSAGSFYIDEEDYEAGTPGDGTWDPDVPDASDPGEVDDGD
jgi:hypothetical protein